MTALFPFAHPRKGLPVSDPYQGRADRLSATRGMDHCDACHRQVDMARDFHQLEWIHGFLQLSCEKCWLSDDRTLTGDASEIDRQLSLVDRHRINLAYEAEDAKRGAPATTDRQTWNLPTKRGRTWHEYAFYAVGILIALAIVGAVALALVAK